MRFNPRAVADESETENRGSGGSGGFSGGIPGIPGGGGIHLGVGGTIIVIILGLIFHTDLLGGITGTDTGAGTGSTSTVAAQPCNGALANTGDMLCEIKLITTSVQDYWKTTFPAQENKSYQVIATRTYTGTTPSACGTAAAAMGPFYCPNDQRVYIELSFMKDMLQGELGAKGGPFALGYVLAHEYGHHIEDQMGILARMRTQQGPDSDSVKAELMADCLGGMWAQDAGTTKDEQGNVIIEDLTKDDVARAIDAAQSVGDDRIQKETSGRVNQEAWTHGSSAERQKWFTIGYNKGSIKACNTFDASSL